MPAFAFEHHIHPSLRRPPGASARAMARRTGCQHWDKGARGEERTGEALDALRSPFCSAIHDVQLARGNFDHFVLADFGLFVIETKYRSSLTVVRDEAVVANGLSTSLKRQHRLTLQLAEVLHARARVDLPVRLILAYAGEEWQRLNKRSPTALFRFIPLTFLKSDLRRFKPILTGDELERVARVVGDVSTWRAIGADEPVRSRRPRHCNCGSHFDHEN